MHHHTKFNQNRSNCCGDRDFCDFQDRGRRHLGFSKIQTFNGRSAVRGHYASFYQISSKSIKRLQRYGDLTFFQNGGRPPSWICWAPIWTSHDDHLMVSIVVQNLVKINAVVSITCSFGLKTPIHAPKLGVSGYFTPKMGSNVNETPKRHILRIV